MADASKILVVQPSWVGDAVMATPTLRALRQRFPQAHISYLMRRYVKPLYLGMPWVDQILTYRTGRTRKKAGKGLVDLAGRLRSAHFDMAIVLPNSFKIALVCKLAKIPRVVGYERDGRSMLLSDKLLAPKDQGKYLPTPILNYYLGLARYLGAAQRDMRMELFVTEAQRQAAERILRDAGLDGSIDRPAGSGGGPLVLLNPGASYGASKCWPAEYFAQLADTLVERDQATILLSAAPRERGIAQEIARQMKNPSVDLSAHGLTLGALKELIRRCDLVITNDTGPRHIAAAMNTPVVTLFGPTDPRWTEINFARETQVAVKVFCGPCQKKVCPLDHRCMTRLTPALALAACREQLPVGAKG